MAEYENRYASRGVGGAGLGLGIAGTALGVINGGLGNIFGGWNGNCNCNENMVVNRYENALQAKIAELETEVKLRDANTFTMGEMGKLRDYVDGKFSAVEKELCDQRVYNATNTATIGCISQQVAQLLSLTKVVIPIANVCPQPAVATTTTTA